MPGTRTGKALLAILLLVAAGALAYVFLPEPVPVDLAEVTRGELRVTVDGEGQTRVKEVYVVSAPVAGRVLRIESHAGDQVTRGETVLATIRPAEPEFLDVRGVAQAEARVSAAKAAKALADARLARARAQLKFALADLERAQKLAARGNISQRALEKAELEAQIRQAEVATARSGVRESDYELEVALATLLQPGQAEDAAASCCVEIRAPASGRVLRLLHESESVVGVGTPLLEIGDPADLEIVVDLLSTDAVRVVEGAEVLIHHWGGSESLRGRVRLVEPSGFTKVSALGIEEQRVNVVVDLVGEPSLWQSLGHGYRVEARTVVWEDMNALRVPVSALFRDRGDWAVFVLSEGEARLRPIRLGQRNSVQAQVLAGLAVGDRVVAHPGDKVADGVPVTERGASGY